MNDFRKPIGSSDPLPVVVSAIEKDRKAGEDFFDPFSNTLFFSAFLLKLKKFLKLFSSQGQMRSAQIDRAHLAEDLQEFKLALQALEQKNLSHNPEFLLQLSAKWHTFLEDSNQITEVEKKYPNFVSQIKLFMLQILSFPKKEEHSLGFYLTECAGKEWIPFPFMDMLEALVREHEQHPDKSQLRAWIATIDSILETTS